MRPSRQKSASSALQSRPTSSRHQGRVTKADIRAAGLRRWDGNQRVTTDWVNLYHEPELYFPDGDLLIYLREPGKSSHGPAFRVHTTYLDLKGFDFLLDRCISRPPILSENQCTFPSCHGCDTHLPPSELYIPAPPNSDLDATFDHHITTRNFFAWIYNLPLAGRTLGQSLVALKERISYYRPTDFTRLAGEIVLYAETQNYLDFRECIDHALAALLLTECLQIEDLWIDAFAHCVGMSHRGLATSLEYLNLSYETRIAINRAQFEMEAQHDFVRRSVSDFFENDFSVSFLGLPQAAKQHLDRFRSWLHSYHIKQHGFWPPNGFEDPRVERDIYASMYQDFRNLYLHLMDPNASTGMTDIDLPASGGVCIAQNIQAFDSRYRYESLPKTRPMLPLEPSMDVKGGFPQRRRSWNPMAKRRIDRDKLQALRIQALIASSNRDWTIMEHPLVRRYSEFEAHTVLDDHETISMIEGRKIRWILIYAVLQTLISVMQTPKQVRNTDGLTYLLCCRPPQVLPWQRNVRPKADSSQQKRQSRIEPDSQYNHSNASSTQSLSLKPVLTSSLSTRQLKEKRRQSLPVRSVSFVDRPSTDRISSDRTVAGRTLSLKRFILGKDSAKEEIPPMPKPPNFCEILVQGYGNGLNEIELTSARPETSEETPEVSCPDGDETPKARTPLAISTTEHSRLFKTEPNSATSDQIPDLTPPSSISVSRESSNASANSSWSKGPSNTSGEVESAGPSSDSTNTDLSCEDPVSHEIEKPKLPVQDLGLPRKSTDGLNHVIDEEGFMTTVHFNTSTWDDLLASV